MNLPNKITLTRILMIPVFAVVFYLDVIPYHFLIAAAVFAVAALTDFLDGHIARSRGLVTDLGKFLDPIADKVLVSTALILLLTRPAVFEVSFLAGWGITFAGISIAVILARELIVSGFRMVAAGKNVVLAADRYGKLKTTFQDIAITVLLAASDLLDCIVGEIAAIGGMALFVVGLVFTLISGINYIMKNRRVLQSGPEEETKE